MKDIKFLFCIVFIYWLVFPIQAQIGKTIAKESVKQVTKSTIKSAVKESMQKSVITDFRKEVLEKMLQKRAKESAQNIMLHGSSQMLTRQAREKLGKEGAETLAKKTVRNVRNDVLAQETKQVATRSVRSLAQEAEFRLVTPMRITSRMMMEKHLKSEVKEAALEKMLGKRATEIWRKQVGGDVAKEKILLEDLRQNPQLRNLFTNNPAYLESYHNMIASVYRKDITMLRYWGNNADKMKLIYQRSPKNREWLKGNDFLCVDINNKTQIQSKSSGKLLGYLEGDVKRGYTIRLYSVENNPLKDLYPLANTTYINGNILSQTDLKGRLIYSEAKIESSVIKGGRDKDYIRRVKEYKSNYDTEGFQKRRTGTVYDDIAGHVIPDSWGGGSDFLNIVPQNRKMNGGGLWKASEDYGRKAAQKGHEVVRKITIEYPDKVSQRPSVMRVTQTVDGSIQNVKGTFMSNQLFINEYQ